MQRWSLPPECRSLLISNSRIATLQIPGKGYPVTQVWFNCQPLGWKWLGDGRALWLTDPLSWYLVQTEGSVSRKTSGCCYERKENESWAGKDHRCHWAQRPIAGKHLRGEWESLHSDTGLLEPWMSYSASLGLHFLNYKMGEECMCWVLPHCKTVTTASTLACLGAGPRVEK